MIGHGAALLRRAISKLAHLFEYGELQASTTPALFVESVAYEVVALRYAIEHMQMFPECERLGCKPLKHVDVCDYHRGEDFRPCLVPPQGWWCSREAGHEGPCAARPSSV